MSWILGVVAEDPNSDLLRHVYETNSDASFLLVRKGVRILTGARTLTRGFRKRSNDIHHADPGPEYDLHFARGEEFAAVAGTATLGTESGVLGNTQMIEVILTGRGAVESSLYEGQFAALRLVGNQIELYCDSNSLRSFYVMEQAGVVIFSTHVSRITRVTGTCELDFHAFGSHWLAHNQIAEKFFVRGIERISGNQTVRFSVKQGSVQTTYTVREKSDSSEESSSKITSEAGRIDSRHNESDLASGTDILGPFIRHIGTGDTPITLALSGGIDSRFVLAALHYHRPGNFSAFVFGDTSDIEIRVVKRLADALSISLDIVPETKDLATLLEDPRLPEFSGELFCTTPISAAGRLLNYSDIQTVRNGAVILDGAFGEFGRARFYRRIEALRRIRYVRLFRPIDIERSLVFHRAPIFSEHFFRQMQSGFRADSEAFFDDLMSFQAATSNAASRPEDLMGLKYRRKNFFGYGQAWIDNWCKNAMPFGQNHTIERLENVPLSKRRRGSFFRNEIRRMAPGVAKHPLVKSGNTYPFSRSLRKILSTTVEEICRPGLDGQGGENESDLRTSPLKRWVPARDKVYDIFHSQSCRTFDAYDRVLIDGLLDEVFVKGVDRTNELDWLLSFELWRKSIRIS